MKYLLSLVLLLTIQPLLAQQTSPYSRFGVGSLYQQEYAPQRGMGNISAAVNDTVVTNYQNPATFGKKLFASLDVGFDVTSKTFKDQNFSDNETNGSINYLAYSFPVNKAKTWGLGFGAQPYSYKNYDITTDFINNRFYREFEGDGNTYRLFLNNGVQLGDLSLGVDAGVFFGRLEDDTYNTFINTGTDISYGESFEQKLRGTNIKLGAQYDVQLKNELTLTFGSTYSLETDLNNEIRKRGFSFRPVFIDERTVTDRIEIDEVVNEVIDSELTLPAEYTVGAYLNKKEKWSLGLDYKAGQWSGFQGVNDDANVNYQDTYSFNLGGSFIPKYRNPGKAYEAFEYRYGGYYSQTYLDVNGEAINDYGITLGVGLPLKRQLPNSRIREIPSSFNFGITVGQLGTLNNDLVQESYVKGSIGVNLNDVWFRKRRYD